MKSTDPGPRPRRRRSAGDRLFVVGVTGGLGAGKTTFVGCCVERGAVALSADAVGYEVLGETGVRDELVRAFGPDVLAADGRVDRERLGRVAFASPENLETLNAISHPRLLRRLADALEGVAASGFEGLVALEAALLVEWDLGPWCDLVVCVTAPPEARVARAAAARGWALEEAKQRIERQLPDETRVRYADRVLENRGSYEEFRRQADVLAAELADLARHRPR